MPLADDLLQLLDIRADFTVRSREGSRLEYKETFNLGSASRYMRTMASFANNSGGFIVFGISDQPRRLMGVDQQRFEAVDPVRLTALLNSSLSPEIHWDSGVLEIHGLPIGFIYTFECDTKPVISTSDRDRDLKEGQVYYRYRGQSRVAQYAELHGMIEERLAREREAWRRHLTRIAEAGPMRVGVLNSTTGRLHGTKGTYVIDRALVDQLTFIREGSFDERDGAPALRLVGNVRPVNEVQPVAPVPLAIGFDDLVNAFVGLTAMEPAVGRAFLEQAFREDSHYLPFHFFRRRADLSVDEALAILDDERVPDRHKALIRSRLRSELRVTPVGAVSDPLPGIVPGGGWVADAGEAQTQKTERSLLLRALSQEPDTVQESLPALDTRRVLEAMTHLSPQAIMSASSALRGILGRVFLDEFYDLDAAARSVFRKALARLDEGLFAAAAVLDDDAD